MCRGHVHSPTVSASWLQVPITATPISNAQPEYESDKLNFSFDDRNMQGTDKANWEMLAAKTTLGQGMEVSSEGRQVPQYKLLEEKE